MFLSLFMLSLTTVLACPCSKAPTLGVRSHVRHSRSRLHTAARQCSCCWGAAVESNPPQSGLHMLGFWSQAGNALLVQQGQSGGRGPRQAPHCDGGQEPSWAQQEREGFFFRGANRSVFSQPAFSSSASHVIQTSALPLSWAPYWQIDTFVEMCSFCHSM